MAYTVDVDEVALTFAHKAIEDELIYMRDNRLGVLGPANGFVVKNYDGSYNPTMRIGTRDGLRIAIKAYLEAVGFTATRVDIPTNDD